MGEGDRTTVMKAERNKQDTLTMSCVYNSGGWTVKKHSRHHDRVDFGNEKDQDVNMPARIDSHSRSMRVEWASLTDGMSVNTDVIKDAHRCVFCGDGVHAVPVNDFTIFKTI